MAEDAVIRAQGLTKRYGATIAVDHIDLDVRAGEIVGILGPNGSGKTTTILMLLGLTEPTSGRAEVAGFDPLRDPLGVKRRVGYMPDRVGFYAGLSARDNLAYTGRLAGLPRRDIDARFADAMERVGLAAVGRNRVRTFSQGMRQRLGPRPGPHFLAGHAAAPRPRRGPDETPERRDPRRADDRARPSFDAGISRDDPR